MSMAWYFHTFKTDSFAQLCGHASPSLKRTLVQAITNPEETEWEPDDDDYKLAERLSIELCTSGIRYSGKSEEESMMLDEIVKMVFNRMGLAKQMGCTPVSRVPLGIGLAQIVVKASEPRMTSILRFLKNGRRVGEQAGEGKACGYIILNQREVLQLKEEAHRLLNDSSVQWADPKAAGVATDAIVPPLEKALSDPSLGLFGTLT